MHPESAMVYSKSWPKARTDKLSTKAKRREESRARILVLVSAVKVPNFVVVPLRVQVDPVEWDLVLLVPCNHLLEPVLRVPAVVALVVLVVLAVDGWRLVGTLASYTHTIFSSKNTGKWRRGSREG